MPELNKLKEEYNGKVNFLAVTFDSKDKVIALLEEHEFNFSHAIDAKKEMDKIKNSVYPINFFIDKNGIVKQTTGMSPQGGGKLFI